MLGKQYTEAWIKHSKSGKDFHRRNFMYPYIKDIAKFIKNAKILDIGCGWGDALTLIDENNEYLGIDPATDFFDYIKQNYPSRKVVLKRGQLPDNIDAPDNYFDLILCCLTIHYVKDLDKSIETIFSKAKNGCKVVIVDIRDDAEQDTREKFTEIYEEGSNYIRGLFKMSDENSTEIVHYFHKEIEFEKEIEKYGNFKKNYLSEAFVGYECIKAK